MRRRAVVLLGVMAAGILLLGLGGTTTLQAIGFAVTAVAGVLLVSLAFFEVGRSEDRARAAEARRHEGRRP